MTRQPTARKSTHPSARGSYRPAGHAALCAEGMPLVWRMR